MTEIDEIRNAINMEKLYSPDFRHKIEHDVRYAVAVINAHSRLVEKKQEIAGEEAARYKKWYGWMSWPRAIALFVFMTIAVFTKPLWCNSPEYLEDCSGTVSDPGSIPVSNLPRVSPIIIESISSVLILFLTANKILKGKYLNRPKHGKLREKIIIGLTVLFFISLILQYAVGIMFQFTLMIRPFYFAIYCKSVRKTITLYQRIVYKSRGVLFLLVVNFFLFACLSKIFFYNSEENEENLPSFSQAIWTLFMTQLGAIFPDVIFPAYTKTRLSMFFFVIFLMINTTFLLNMVIAVFFFHCKQELTKLQKHILGRYDLYNIVHEIVASGDMIEETIEKELIEKGILEFRGALRNKTTTSENLGKATVEDRRGMIRMEQGQKLSKFKILLLEIVFKPVVGYVLLVCSILGFAASTWQSTVIAPFPDEDPDDPEFHAFNTYFYLTEGILNILMFIEPMLRLIALGPKSFIHSKFYVWELLTSFIAAVLMFGELFAVFHINLYLLHIILVSRAARILKFISETERFEIIFDTFYKLVPLFKDNFSVLMVFAYGFVVVSITVFGGKYRTDLPIEWEKYHLEKDFIYLNFNDFGMGFQTACVLLLLGGFEKIVNLSCVVMESNWFRLYFIMFYVVAVLIGLNMIVAFIIDMFADQLMEREREEETRYDHLELPKNQAVQLVDEHEEGITSPLMGKHKVEISMNKIHPHEPPEENSPTRRNVPERPKTNRSPERQIRVSRRQKLGGGPRRINLNSNPEFERRLEEAYLKEVRAESLMRI